MRSPLAFVMVLLVPMLVGGDVDPGVVIVVDLDAYELHTHDAAASRKGPSLPVAVGSPTHPTPTGEFTPVRVVKNPSWTPGAWSRSLGARPLPPSSDGPLGIGKLPLEFGGIQIHAGADPLELGKPISLGCVQIDDAGWRALIAWLEERHMLEPWRHVPGGEIETFFRRPIRVVVR